MKMKLEVILYVFALLNIYTIEEEIDADISSQSPISRDTKNCLGHKDINTCSSVEMISNVYQCCKASVSGYSYAVCSPWIIADLSAEQIKDMEESTSENYAFLEYAVGIRIPSSTITYTCAKKTYTFHLGTRTYTEKEIEIIKDENYCMRLYYTGLSELEYVSNLIETEEREITREDCMNAKTLPNSKNSCAFASFNFKLDDDTYKKLSTCIYISKTTLETKNLDEFLKSQFQSIASSDIGDGQSVESFEVEIADKDGKTLKYDSKSGALIDETEENKTENLKIFNLLLLSLLILYL
jgi:hypothetical protein